jgi:hypothetical protein
MYSVPKKYSDLSLYVKKKCSRNLKKISIAKTFFSHSRSEQFSKSNITQYNFGFGTSDTVK